MAPKLVGQIVSMESERRISTGTFARVRETRVAKEDAACETGHPASVFSIRNSGIVRPQGKLSTQMPKRSGIFLIGQARPSRIANVAKLGEQC
ncbi:MAG: hypothetical protein WBS18_07145, partial [Candidatus Acidiferrales bacterium]